MGLCVRGGTQASGASTRHLLSALFKSCGIGMLPEAGAGGADDKTLGTAGPKGSCAVTGTGAIGGARSLAKAAT